MLTANLRVARKLVVVLFLVGLAIAFAGARHQQAQNAARVTWQDVSATLQDVEIAKRDLFQSMQEKTGAL